MRRRILVRRRGDGKAGSIVDKPGPAAAEPVDRSAGELLLECVEALEGSVERACEVAVWLPISVRVHDLPIQRVVRVAAPIVPHRCPSVLRQELEIAEDLLDRPVGPLVVDEVGLLCRH
jgi:hypothetical protein